MLILPSWICTSKLRTVYLLAVAMCVLVTLLRNAFLAFEQCLEQLTGGGSRRSARLFDCFLPHSFLYFEVVLVLRSRKVH